MGTTAKRQAPVTMDEMEKFPDLNNLVAAYPWLPDLFDLSEGSYWIISSENRDGQDLARVCASLNQLFASCLANREDALHVVAVRKIFGTEGVVTRRMGPFAMGRRLSMNVSLDWHAEYLFTTNGDTVAIVVGKTTSQISISHLMLALKFPTVFLIGSLDESNALQWLEFASRELVSNSRPYGEVRLHFDSCIKLFPSGRPAGVVAFGSDDFGGYFALGCEMTSESLQKDV